jgi:transposase
VKDKDMNAELIMERGRNEGKTATPLSLNGGLVIPLNLGEWMAPERLLESITASVEELNWSNPGLGAYLETHPEYRPKMLFRLLAFAYATGIFDAEEIESNCFADPFFRYICEGEPPRPRDISRFRRENRFLLKWVLTQVLIEALKKKFNLGNTPFPAGLRRFLVAAVVERLDLARHLDRAGYEL